MATRRLTKKGRQRHRQLMEYATQRFAEHGYHSTSVDDLVNGIGVGKGVFYWYFSSKEQLLVEILEHYSHDLRRAQRQAIGDVADPVESLQLGLRATMRWLIDHQDAFTLFTFAATQESFSEVVRTEQGLALNDAVALVQRFPGIGSQHAVVLANAVLGVSNQLAQALLIEKGRPPDEVADAAVAFCLHGLVGAQTTKAPRGGTRAAPRKAQVRPRSGS